MILTTLESVPSKTIIAHYGIVQGSTVRTKNLEKGIEAKLKNIVGGEIKPYTNLLQESCQEAIERMAKQAEAMGANAIVGIRLGTASIMQGAAELIAYGTAVKVE
jgi:uncharacterized protein YbjQ (UPF0145 family)